MFCVLLGLGRGLELLGLAGVQQRAGRLQPPPTRPSRWHRGQLVFAFGRLEGVTLAAAAVEERDTLLWMKEQARARAKHANRPPRRRPHTPLPASSPPRPPLPLLWPLASQQDLPDEALAIVGDALAGVVHTRDTLAARLGWTAGGCS